MMRTVVLAVALVACGGGNKGGDTTPVGGGGDEGGGTVSDGSENMIPPEKMDEVQNILKRKNMIMSRCLASAMENKEVPKSTKGKVTLQIIIDTSGKASTVKVLKTSIEAQSVQDCVVGHVREMTFPEMPRSYETSYTYAMEAN